LRPEIHPVEESGDGELRLHTALMESPRKPVSEKELAAVEDADARDNYRTILGFRQKLLDAGTIEGCYRSLFKAPIDIPPMFVDQLVHVILRNMLDGCDDPLRLRAGEVFFREQKATIQEGHVLLADLETVEMHASGNRYGSIGRLIVEAQGSVFQENLDVLDRSNAALYWERESRHDTVISLTYGRPALDAFCRVLESWVGHFLRVKELWSGAEIEQGRMRNILAIFALRFDDPAVMRTDVRGRTVYLALSCEDGVVRMKPQNLLTNLPVHEA
jgi:Family of unknown function (DUF6352)